MNIRDIVDLANARSTGYGLTRDYLEDEEEQDENLRQRFQRRFADATNQHSRQDNDGETSGTEDDD